MTIRHIERTRKKNGPPRPLGALLYSVRDLGLTAFERRVAARVISGRPARRAAGRHGKWWYASPRSGEAMDGVNWSAVRTSSTPLP
jgi:hypothetical protein